MNDTASARAPVRKAMLLAAGLGSRLQPLTSELPKPAVPLMGRPLIEYALRQLQRIGVTDVVVNLHYRPDGLEASFEKMASEGLTVHLSYEPEILGTAGGLKKAEALLCDDTPFLLWNADTLAELDFRALADLHQSTGSVATLLLRAQPDGTHYSTVSTDAAGRITALGEPEGKAMFAGIWLLEPTVFDFLSGRAAGLQHELLPRLIAEGTVFGSLQSGAFLTIDDPNRYLDANLLMARSKLFNEDWAVSRSAAVPGLLSGEGARCDDQAAFFGDCILGARSRIAPGARLEDTILWDDVVVENGARLRRSVVTRGACVPAGLEAREKIIMRSAEGTDAHPAVDVFDLVADGALRS